MKFREVMDFLGEVIEITLKEYIGVKMGFVLITFEFNVKEGVGSYISNGNREDIIKSLKEMIFRLENKEDISETIGEA